MNVDFVFVERLFVGGQRRQEPLDRAQPAARGAQGQSTVGRAMPQRMSSSASIRPTVVALTRTPVVAASCRASRSWVQVGRAQP